jgi:hypothetical protein
VMDETASAVMPAQDRSDETLVCDRDCAKTWVAHEKASNSRLRVGLT